MSNETVEKIGFGFVSDTDESLKTKSGGKCGLNQPVFLTKFELNENAGKDGAEQDALDINVQVVERDMMMRIYPTEKVYNKDNEEITDKSSAEYASAYNKDWTQKNALIVHILKCFRTEEEIEKALTAKISSFSEFVKIVTSLVPDDFSTKPLDVFLEYQWEINTGQDRTFLQLPKNMKGSYFLIPMHKAEGEWETINNSDGLRYVDSKTGKEHPFTRSENYMSSYKANKQVEGEEESSNALKQAADTGTAKKEKW